MQTVQEAKIQEQVSSTWGSIFSSAKAYADVIVTSASGALQPSDGTAYTEPVPAENGQSGWGFLPVNALSEAWTK